MTRELEYLKTGAEFGAGSIETLGPVTDKYDIIAFAHDDFPRFHELVSYLSPRDQEIILCFALLRKRPTDLSILFGKAGHRAEEDLHKAAHKLAGLAEFGPLPEIDTIDSILRDTGIQNVGSYSFAASTWQYARSRDFGDIQRLVGGSGLRQEMLRTFKKLHAAEGREAGLLAGWILWLVDGSDPKGKGWRQRKRTGREHKLGPTVFYSAKNGTRPQDLAKQRTDGHGILPRSTGRGGYGQNPGGGPVKITRKIKFLLRGMNG